MQGNGFGDLSLFRDLFFIVDFVEESSKGSNN
jgi:hypothetical protein